MARRVRLHIGTMKSATSYLQALCELHVDHLANAGILWPTGLIRYAAVRDLFGTAEGRTDPPAAWSTLVRRIDEHEGDVALSNELLAHVGDGRISLLLDALAGNEIHVIVTARDLARVIPSAWQTSVRNGARTWSWSEFSTAVCSDPDQLVGRRARSVHRWFWHQHDVAALVTRWMQHVPADRFTLVTVPPPGGDPEALPERFGAAIGVTLRGLPQPGTRATNTTLGAHSTELVRRVSLAMPDADPVHRVYGLKLALAGTVLSRRAAAEPSFGLSDAQRDWARARARTMVDELGTLGIAIIGDLADLIPCEAGHAGFDPGRTNKTELLSAAVDALVGLTKHTARLRARCEALRSELTAVQLECDVLRSQLESSGTGSTGSSLAG